MSCDPALLGLDQAKQDARKAGFARSVRADQRHDFAAGYRNVDAVQYPATIVTQHDFARVDQRRLNVGHTAILAVLRNSGP